ncbi:MAG: hypothetical protein ACI4R6_00090, partial [Lachnospiraceae bacterium]
MKHNISNEGKSNVAAILGIFAGVSLCILCLLIAVYMLKQQKLASAVTTQQTTAYQTNSEPDTTESVS